MTVVQETLLVAGHDVRRSLTSARGIVLLVLSLMGALMVGAAMSAVRTIGVMGAAASNIDPRDAAVVWQGLLAAQYNGDVELAKHLAQIPVLLYFNAIAGARFAAALVALIGFDAVAGDLQYGAVRYFTVRVGRLSYYAGKVLGLFVVASVMMFFTHAFVWTFSMLKDGTSFSEILRWGPTLWLVDVAVVVAWAGIGQLIAAQFRSPVLALLVTFAAFFGIWIMKWIALHYPSTEWLAYVYPCQFDAWLLSPRAERAAVGAFGCVGVAVVTSAAGVALFSRRDV